MDFSRPEKYLPEIMEFLNNITIPQNLNIKPGQRNISQSEAQLLIYYLLRIIAPNYKEPTPFTANNI
jgi:hypothetical protein